MQNHILKQVNSKMVNPSAKRRAAPRSMENGAGSKSAACRELGLARSGLYRQAKSSVEGRRHPQGGAGTQRQASSLRLSALVSMWRCMRRGPSGPWMSSLSWKRLLPATEHQSICAATTDRSHCLSNQGLAKESRHQDDLHHPRQPVGTERSQKGEAKPRQNGYIESFHDKLRDECLNRELFGSLLEARVILETWRIEYNESRPHSSLRYLAPGEFVRRSNSGLRSPSGLPASRVAINSKTNHNQHPAELQI